MKNLCHIILLTLVLMFVGNMSSWAVDETPDYYDTQVRKLYKAGHWEEGKKLLDSTMDDYGTLSAFNELQGMYFYHFKKYTQARYYLIRSIRDDKSNNHSLELLVYVEEETKNYSSAICYVNEILEINPYSKGWWRKKIDLYRMSGNDEEADRLLKRLRQIFPNDRDVMNDAVQSQEIILKKAKQKGDIEAQVNCLREILKDQPRNDDYHMRLINILIQSGRTTEAIEAASNAVTLTHMAKFVKKKVEILSEQGRFTEAMNYVKDCQKTFHISTGSLLSSLELEAARNARNNDPYTMYGRIYEKTHSKEALDYLLNTAQSRGYFDDLLTYIAPALKAGTRDPKTLYRAYIGNLRLGNRNQARKYLEKLVEVQPSNPEYQNDLCLLYLYDAAEDMQQNEYANAIAKLQYILMNTQDKETLKSADMRLFSCYMEEKQYSLAASRLEKIKPYITELSYTLDEANILHLEGRNTEALAVLKKAYGTFSDVNDRYTVSSFYEEIAYPYIRSLMERGMNRQAFNVVLMAVDICPRSVNIISRAITCAAILKENIKYAELVGKARNRFPDDPVFVVKEAGIYTLDKDYPKALDIIRPLIDTYVGDSTIVGAYSENSELLALQLLKEKYPYHALAIVDSALVHDSENRSLLYAKGLIFEDLHQYDSAYVYQKNYNPSLIEVGAFSHHLEELMSKNGKNQLIFGYQYWRPGSEDTRTSNASLEYTRKYKNETFTGTLIYAGRDGATASSMTKEEQVSGGTGISAGLSWTHRWRPNLSWTIGGAYATKYLPQITARIAIDWQLKNDWTLNFHGSARRIDSYSKHYDPQTVYDSENVDPINDYIQIMTFTGWDHKKLWLYSGGAIVSKTVGLFNIAVNADAFYMNKNIYWNAGTKMQFFPVEGNTSHFYAMGGLGSAPEMEIIEKSMPSGFSDINTYVGMGGMYVLNRHVSLSLSGLWYTMYNQSKQLISVYVSDTTVATTYKNQIFINAQVILTF